jgi:tRNA-binding protein
MQQIEWEDFKEARFADRYAIQCVCNFAAKRIAGVRSDVQMTGIYDADPNAVLAGCDSPLPNDARLA